MSNLYCLSEAQVDRLKPFFRKSHDKPRVDDRRVLRLTPRSWCDLVILPTLTGRDRRTHAAIFSFMAGVTPPMPMLGRSLL
ncbi:hypothetical protein C8J28_1742 [Cereibacter azotoformans]|uniref:Transposase n=1 Tax=Cereibacter azotoformans TaxID=43057 RepID=A0A2T5JHC4_9RHOB|nr:hypothetical protein C8J28_1742 [Cereibacter azotoformans]